MLLSHQKLVIAGDFLHHFNYSHPIKYDYQTSKIKTGARIARQTPASLDDFNFNNARAKRAVKYLVQANATQDAFRRTYGLRPAFITLTFRRNVNQISEANPIFKKFVHRTNYFLKPHSPEALKYLVVPEFQKLTRDAVHYHAIFFNLPYVERIYDTFMQLWGQGNVNVRAVYNPNQLSNYVVKYITKQNPDIRLFNKKKYFTSRNLIRPIEIKNEQKIAQELSTLNRIIWQKEYYIPQLSQSLLYSHYKRI